MRHDAWKANIIDVLEEIIVCAKDAIEEVKEDDYSRAYFSIVQIDDDSAEIRVKARNMMFLKEVMMC